MPLPTRIAITLLAIGLLFTANPLQAAALLVQPQGLGARVTHTHAPHAPADRVSTRPSKAEPASRPGLFWGLGALILAVGGVALFFSVGFLIAELAILVAIVFGAIGIGKGRRGRIWAMIGLGIALLFQLVVLAYSLLLFAAFAYG